MRTTSWEANLFWTMAMWRTQLSPVTAKAVWDLWASQTLNYHVSPVFWLPWTACLWVILSFPLELHQRYKQFADQDLKLFPDGVNSLHLPKKTQCFRPSLWGTSFPASIISHPAHSAHSALTSWLLSRQPQVEASLSPADPWNKIANKETHLLLHGPWARQHQRLQVKALAAGRAGDRP